MSNWRFNIGLTPTPGSDPTLPLKRIGWMRQAADRQINLGLNRSGDAGFSHPSVHKLAPYLMSGPDYCLIAERDGVDVWTGPFASNQGVANTNKAGKITVKAVGWLELLEYRELREDVTYGVTNPATGAGWKAYEIIFDLLARVRGYPSPPPPIVQGAWFQGTNPPVSIQKAWTKTTKIGRCIAELTEMENGVDVLVDPLTRKLNVYDNTVFIDRPALVWGFNKPPFNIEQFGWQSDYMQMRNRLFITGPGGSSGFAQDTTSQNRFHVFEETINLPDARSANTLAYYAESEVALKGRPYTFFNFTPNTSRPNGPLLFRDFKIGDQARLSVDHGPIQEVETAVRIFTVSLAIADNGSEKLTTVQTLANG